MVYLRYHPDIVRGCERSGVVLYDGTHLLAPKVDALTPGIVVVPYFPRAWDRFCGHNQTPSSESTGFSAVVVGAGDQAGAFGFDVFRHYATHGQLDLRRAIRIVLGRLLPRPLVRSGLPSHAEVTLTRQGERIVLHVLSYVLRRRTPGLDLVEEATPLVDDEVAVRMEAAPKEVLRVPGGGGSFAWDFAEGYVRVRLSSVRGHEMFVME